MKLGSELTSEQRQKRHRFIIKYIVIGTLSPIILGAFVAWLAGAMIALLVMVIAALSVAGYFGGMTLAILSFDEVAAEETASSEK